MEVFEVQISQQVGNTQAFNHHLDEQASELEKEHRCLLAAAAIEHDRVRKDAEAEMLVEQERWRIFQMHKNIADAEQLVRLRQEAAETQRRAAETEAAAVAAAIAEESAKEKARAAIQLARQHAVQKAAEAKQQATEINTQTNDSKEKSNSIPPIHAANPPPTVQPLKVPTSSQANQVSRTTVTSQTSASSTQNPQAVAIHQKYLATHRQLKELRKSIATITDAQLKKTIGEYRRELRKSVGQLTTNMASNTAPYNKIRSILINAGKLQQPLIDIKPFIVNELPPELANQDATAGIVLIYLLNIFSKAVVSQFVNEAGVAPKSAEPIGTIAIRIFAADDFKWRGISMIDILIAKFHAVCPVLFGMYKAGPSAAKQKHGEALTGLGAGFAALSLRDFRKVKAVNPFPPLNYWQAIARIVNTPANQTTEAHYIVLKAMVENHAETFIKFFGQAAIAVLRKAVVDFSQQAAKGLASPTALATLETTFKRNHHLTIRTH